MLFSLQILEDFPEIFLLFVSYLVLLWSGKYILYDLNLLRVTEAYFMAQNLVSVDKCTVCTSKECVFHCWLECFINAN